MPFSTIPWVAMNSPVVPKKDRANRPIWLSPSPSPSIKRSRGTWSTPSSAPIKLEVNVEPLLHGTARAEDQAIRPRVAAIAKSPKTLVAIPA